MQRGGAASEVDAGQRALAQTDAGGCGTGVEAAGGACRGGNEERAEEGGEVGVVADDQQVLVAGVLAQELRNWAKVASGASAAEVRILASYPISVPTSEAVCMQRFKGLETMRSNWSFMALRTWASWRQWRLPSLSRGRLWSRTGLARFMPALA